MAEEVGIRELRQNLSAYLRRVADGERFTVTQHNKPIAQLGPAPDVDEEYERVCAELGIVRGTGDVYDIPVIKFDDVPGGMTLMDALWEQRGYPLDEDNELR